MASTHGLPSTLHHNVIFTYTTLTNDPCLAVIVSGWITYQPSQNYAYTAQNKCQPWIRLAFSAAEVTGRTSQVLPKGFSAEGQGKFRRRLGKNEIAGAIRGQVLDAMPGVKWRVQLSLGQASCCASGCPARSHSHLTSSGKPRGSIRNDTTIQHEWQIAELTQHETKCLDFRILSWLTRLVIERCRKA
jgi:hypothetical protein